MLLKTTSGTETQMDPDGSRQIISLLNLVLPLLTILFYYVIRWRHSVRIYSDFFGWFWVPDDLISGTQFITTYNTPKYVDCGHAIITPSLQGRKISLNRDCMVHAELNCINSSQPFEKYHSIRGHYNLLQNCQFPFVIYWAYQSTLR